MSTANTNINLLPDIRQEKLRVQRRRRLAASIGTIVSGSALGLMIILFLTVQGQNLRIGALQRDINNRQDQINSTPNLVEMVTVQQHLAAIPGLLTQRVLLSRFFTVLQTISSKDLAVTGLDIDSQNILKIGATARNYAAAAKFAEALEASNYSLGPDASTNNQPHFSNVTVETVTTGSDSKATFAVSATMSAGVTHGK